MLALLRHLEAVGFEMAPRVAGGGFAPDSRETLGYVEGKIQHPDVSSDDALFVLGHQLRELHNASASLTPLLDAVWHPWFARDLPGDRPVIGHGDLAPWNIIARQGAPVAFIDWDYAGPVDAVWDWRRRHGSTCNSTTTT